MSIRYNQPVVTILLPCYNVEQFLPQCLDSIINQTYKDLQIVCIDDGSTDNTWQVLQDYAVKDIRIEVYHQDNQGVASTRNNLLDKVKGEYVLFIDSDDWIEQDMVAFLVLKSLETECRIVTCSIAQNDTVIEPDKQNENIWNRQKVVREFLRHVSFNGSLCNKLIDVSLLNNVRFHCEISYGEDALFIWEVIQRVEKILITDKQLYHYRMNVGSISAQQWTPYKKGSGHLVWKQIVSDTERLWPQFLDIAKARYATEDMWGLYFASLANYPYDEHIKERQQNVRKNLKLISKNGLISKTKIVFAYVIAYCYPLGKLLQFTR